MLTLYVHQREQFEKLSESFAPHIHSSLLVDHLDAR